MSIGLWSLVRFGHVLGAVLWVGGQLTLTLVVRPAADRRLGDEERLPFFVEAGERYAWLATWVLMPVLLASGLALAWHRGVSLQGLARPGYGMMLGAKIVLAFISFGLAALHGMMATRPGTSAARTVSWVGGLVAVGVVLLATALVP